MAFPHHRTPLPNIAKPLCLGFVVDCIFSGGAAGDFLLTPHCRATVLCMMVFISAEAWCYYFSGWCGRLAVYPALVLLPMVLFTSRQRMRHLPLAFTPAHHSLI